MNEDEINGAIAKFCGTLNSVRYEDGGGPGASHYFGDPNYCGDLNEMHKAIIHLRKTGNQFQWLEFDKQLFKVLWGRSAGCPEETYYLSSLHSFDQVNATARQRAEAFLKTIIT